MVVPAAAPVRRRQLANRLERRALLFRGESTLHVRSHVTQRMRE